MSAVVERHRRVVDLFVLMHRDDGRVLLLRRAGQVYASGLLAPPSGHLEAGETVREGALREAYEEVGVTIAPGDLEFCHLIDHRNPEGCQRLGVAFTAQRWSGRPYNREPHRHSQLVWAEPARPPADCVPYTSALLTRFAEGALLSTDGYGDGHGYGHGDGYGDGYGRGCGRGYGQG
ncbi:NUDIX domain-containing protein [Streptomyces iconiensis]|uniref:NUDIX domain-containing protein n=1 Tax=Streptomyces iconiensis TaxID=1384038 RepID=A0ABT7A7P6_9ACTN|nr:NUDIX domain-containing protein [Streptomyces iconiensis]MDJ1137358.1 NUDIX domain-containing protein [Streptomyces iconiensis]